MDVSIQLPRQPGILPHSSTIISGWRDQTPENSIIKHALHLTKSLNHKASSSRRMVLLQYQYKSIKLFWNMRMSKVFTGIKDINKTLRFRRKEMFANGWNVNIYLGWCKKLLPVHRNEKCLIWLKLNLDLVIIATVRINICHCLEPSLKHV